MKNSRMLPALCVCFITLIGSTSHAQLIDRGGGMIYDADQDITWLQDASYAITSGFDADGRMTWDVANAWAENLVFGGFDDWRLPKGDLNCGTGNSFDCTNNEMGYLFYIHFGNVAGQRATPDPLFQNVIVTNVQYWTGTVLPTFPPDILALYFNFNTGFQAGSFFTDPLYAWPVRDGDVLPSVVQVDIDIKPGSDPNSINLKSRGNIPVALFTSDKFDATQVDWETVLFGPSGATESHERAHIEDVDLDGDMDMVLHFGTKDTGIQCGDIEATLTGETFGGEAITGSDSIVTVKCN